MNFNRISLKTKAKQILRKNWGWAILVTLILTLVTPTAATSYVSNEVRDLANPYRNTQVVQNEQGIDIDAQNRINLYRYRPDIILKRYKEEVDSAVRSVMPNYPGSTWALFVMALMVSLFIAFALKVFVLNPIHVGCMKWYLRNRTENKPKMRALVETFTEGYIRIVAIMFLRDLFTFLWALLLIVPGIIKSYEYRMIPYLLAENPDLTVSEAFGMTKKIMDGNKMDTFILDLSFFPWILLAAMTCGILSVVYVAPYMALTNTELYVCLCQGKDRYETSS